MKKFLSSKIFVIICTLTTLIIGGIAGWLLGYQPNVNGKVTGSVWGTSISGIGSTSGSTSGSTTTQYVFQLKTACGYWLLALVISLTVFLLCLLIRKLYISGNAAKNDDNQ